MKNKESSASKIVLDSYEREKRDPRKIKTLRGSFIEVMLRRYPGD